MADDPLDDFERVPFTHGDKTRDTFRKGSGPTVIVIAEMPGITPKVAEFARRVVDLGCTAVMPHLFGDPGRDPTPKGRPALGYGVSSMIPACISREFTVWATGRTSPVIDWLRALARHEHERCGGPGHLSIVELAARVLRRRLVVVLANPQKDIGAFSRTQRVDLVTASTRHLPNVSVHGYHGRIVDAAADLGADVLLRSAHKEAQHERSMAATNELLAGIQTSFVMPDAGTAWISSTMVRQLTAAGHLDVLETMMPRPVHDAFTAA